MVRSSISLVFRYIRVLSLCDGVRVTRWWSNFFPIISKLFPNYFQIISELFPSSLRRVFSKSEGNGPAPYSKQFTLWKRPMHIEIIGPTYVHLSLAYLASNPFVAVSIETLGKSQEPCMRVSPELSSSMNQPRETR